MGGLAVRAAHWGGRQKGGEEDQGGGLCACCGCGGGGGVVLCRGASGCVQGEGMWGSEGGDQLCARLTPKP